MLAVLLCNGDASGFSLKALSATKSEMPRRLMSKAECASCRLPKRASGLPLSTPGLRQACQTPQDARSPQEGRPQPETYVQEG